jgi:hypothetical protein
MFINGSGWSLGQRGNSQGVNSVDVTCWTSWRISRAVVVNSVGGMALSHSFLYAAMQRKVSWM